MHSKPEKEMTEEELKKKEYDRKHFHSYRDVNKDGYIDRVMKWLHFVILISTIHPIKRDAVTIVCAGMKFAQQFSRPGKSLKTGDKVWKSG